MTSAEIRSVVLSVLGRLAPEADLTTIDPSVSLRDQLDLDSVDFLNFVLAIHKELGVEIPEKDYPKFATLNACLEHLAGAAAPGCGPASPHT